MDRIESGLRYPGLTPDRAQEIGEVVPDYLWLPMVLVVSPMLLAALMAHWMAGITDTTHRLAAHR
jgi:hypothetical protein